MKTMKKITYSILFTLLVSTGAISSAYSDSRQLVELPEMMQQHMMSNMRDHLQTINLILIHLGKDEMDMAAELAEQNLGMSSMNSHGASRLAKFMPEGMRAAGTSMHKKASRFALVAQEGDLLAAYKMLAEITSACVGCHAGYRIQ